MFYNYKINTRKKRFAFEVLILTFTILFSSIIYFLGDYYETHLDDVHYKKEEEIKSKIDTLKNTRFRNRYESLHKNQRISDYTYNSYKRNILNDKDSSFRRIIYQRLCNLYEDYGNEKTFYEFINQFEYDSINNIDDEIDLLENQLEILSKQRPGTEVNPKKEYHIILILILIILIYPVRILYYIIRWSFNTLKETESSKLKEDKRNEVSDYSEKESETKDKLNTENTRQNEKVDSNKSSIIKNYFNYNSEYITGFSYLTRMILGTFTLIIFGLGVLIMFSSIYKRSKSLGFSKTLTIFNCVYIPLWLIISVVINNIHLSDFSNNDILLFSLIQILMGVPHLILIFKNGTRKKIGKFQLRT